MDAPKLGQILEGEQYRDAIHIAIAPVVAGQTLSPGQHIGFLKDGTVGVSSQELIGIVDPFLKSNVKKKQQFFMFLYPNTITSLRHEWTHPAFETNNAEKVIEGLKRLDNTESHQFMKNFAKRVRLAVPELMEAAKAYLETGEDRCLNFNTPDEVYTQRSEFWRHYELLTNEEVEDKDATFFHCAC